MLSSKYEFFNKIFFRSENHASNQYFSLKSFLEHRFFIKPPMDILKKINI